MYADLAKRLQTLADEIQQVGEAIDRYRARTAKVDPALVKSVADEMRKPATQKMMVDTIVSQLQKGLN